MIYAEFERKKKDNSWIYIFIFNTNGVVSSVSSKDFLAYCPGSIVGQGIGLVKGADPVRGGWTL